MIYKTCSVKRVIAKVFTDNDLQEEQHRVSDMIEWAGSALEKIGAFSSFINKVAGKDGVRPLILLNYQTKLPCDFHKLIQVAYSKKEEGPFYPMRYATGSFDWGSEITEAAASDLDYVAPESALITLAMELYDLSYQEALNKINAESTTRSMLNGMLKAMDDNAIKDKTGGTDYTTDYTYLIKPDYIKTNVETGYIMLAYQAVPTDSEGYPLIPDDASFIEAVYWYITMKLLYPQWKEGRVRDAVYYDARRSWNYHCKQAYGNALMPNKDQLESIKNTWLRLVPEIMEHNTSFSTLGERQLIYNAN